MSGTAERLTGGLIAGSVLVVTLAIPELTLRAAGFRHEPGIGFAPSASSFRRYVPDEELFWRWDHRDVIVEKHRSYTDLTRQVAHRNGWLLLDLEHELRRHPAPGLIFSNDGIHYSPTGKAVIGAIVARSLLPLLP